jgi:hypothetical protein
VRLLHDRSRQGLGSAKLLALAPSSLRRPRTHAKQARRRTASGKLAAVELSEVLSFARRHPLAVQASASPAGAPQAAVVGVVVSDAFEVFFDTLDSSRKSKNLRQNPRIALVIGWDLEEGRTVQLEGAVDEPRGADLERLQQVYFERFADGVERLSWPGITYVRVRPTWLRYSDFTVNPTLIVEFDASAFQALSHQR